MRDVVSEFDIITPGVRYDSDGGAAQMGSQLGDPGAEAAHAVLEGLRGGAVEVGVFVMTEAEDGVCQGGVYA